VQELLVVEPVFAERLWGGTTLRAWFGEAVPEGIIGECWAVSGMPGMSGSIRSGDRQGFTLRQAWADGLVTGHQEAGDFPLLCKFLDPQDWLSVQVHPDDAQARALEGQPRGKAECWLVVSARDDAALILGHTAATADDLRQALADGTLMQHLVTVPVVPDDFFMVNAGEVHSVGPGMLVYEVQQSSDITYRLYDFDRVGPDGQARELHVDKGFSVVSAPHDPAAARTAGPWEQIGAGGRTRVLVDCPQFRVQRWELLNEDCQLEAPGYRVLTIIGGSGTLSTDHQSVELGLGTSVVIPAGVGPVRLAGDHLIAITTDPGPALA
jgi:mannose-6-phosphate isomerase